MKNDVKDTLREMRPCRSSRFPRLRVWVSGPGFSVSNFGLRREFWEAEGDRVDLLDSRGKKAALLVRDHAPDLLAHRDLQVSGTDGWFRVVGPGVG